jgi:hypothetical protein
VPADDNRAVRGGSSNDLEVLSNDTDPDGDINPSSLRIVSGPAIGSAYVNGRSIHYTAPATDVNLKTDIRYRICDSGGRCADATLRIVITPSTI